MTSYWHKATSDNMQTSRPKGRVDIVRFIQHRFLTRYSDQALLDKYGLKADDAILAEEKHLGIYEDLLNNYEAKLIAGGAAQNSARGAQVRYDKVDNT
jgi:hypothetical protein